MLKNRLDPIHRFTLRMKNRTMHIAQIKSDYDLPIPPAKGGAIEHWIYEVVNRLKLYRRTVFAIKPECYSANEAVIDAVNYQWFSVTPFEKFISTKIGLERILRFNPFILKNKIKHDKFDIWHVHNAPFITPFLKKICPNSKIILHLHNSFPSLIKTTLPRDLKPYYKAIDCIVAVSEFIKNEALNYVPNTLRSTVIHNGVDAERFKPVSQEKSAQIKQEYRIAPDKKIILYTGRLIPEKGIHILIKAVEHIVNKNHNALLIIAGSDFFSGSSMKTPYILELRRKASKILNNIIFLGHIQHSELHNLYAMADICVVPSVWNEPSGLVNLEAQSSGVSLIASKVGGIPEIIVDGVTGILIKSEDCRELANTLELLLKNEDLRKTFGQNARKHILSSFTWEHTAKKCSELYSRINSVT